MSPTPQHAKEYIAKLENEIERLRAEVDEVAKNGARVLMGMAADAAVMRAALEQNVSEGECYCTDNVAAPGPCGHCIARQALATDAGKEAAEVLAAAEALVAGFPELSLSKKANRLRDAVRAYRAKQ